MSRRVTSPGSRASSAREYGHFGPSPPCLHLHREGHVIEDFTPQTATAEGQRHCMTLYDRIAVVVLQFALSLLDRGRHFDAAASVSSALDRLGWEQPPLSEGEANAWLERRKPTSRE